MTATSKDLGKLHKLLTEVLTKEVEDCIEPKETIVGFELEPDEDGNQVPIKEMVRTPISPGMVSAVANFLKNNNVTAGTDDAALKDLEARLAEARSKRPGKVVPLHPVTEAEALGS